MSRRKLDNYQVFKQEGVEFLMMPELVKHTRSIDIDLKKFLFMKNLSATLGELLSTLQLLHDGLQSPDASSLLDYESLLAETADLADMRCQSPIREYEDVEHAYPGFTDSAFDAREFVDAQRQAPAADLDLDCIRTFRIDTRPTR